MHVIDQITNPMFTTNQMLQQRQPSRFRQRMKQRCIGVSILARHQSGTP